jgi:Tfp pilus tip-associated adhesin PilY1
MIRCNSYKILLLFSIFTVLLIHCNESPQGIQNAFFEDLPPESPKVNLAFNFTSDTNNKIDSTKSFNGIPNWSERLYFDATISNTLDGMIRDVKLLIKEVDSSRKIEAFSDDTLYFGSILPSQSADPDTYWCISCTTDDEIYLGRTWVKAGNTISSTSSATLTLSILFKYEDNQLAQEVSHTFNIYP